MIVLAEKNKVTTIKEPAVWSETAMELRGFCWDAIGEYESYMNDNLFHMALASLWRYINKVNAYFHSQEPWKLARKDNEAFMEVLSATANSLRVIAYLLWSVMPQKMEQLLGSLGVVFKIDDNMVEELALDRWAHDFTIKKMEPLFKKPLPHDEQLPQVEQPEKIVANKPVEKTIQKVVEKPIEKLIEKPIEKSIETLVEKPTKEESQPKPVVAKLAEKPMGVITIDDLIKVQLVVGQIEQCEPVPGSEKMYAMQVDFGQKGKRIILAGVRKFVTIEELVDKQGIFVLNLKPRKILGLESQGMMLVAKTEQGGLALSTVAQPVPNGSRLQ